jgi:KUP system potassium uptake protein
MSHSSDSPPNGALRAGIVLAALGVVYGDIGTSPLYAFKEAMGAAQGVPPDPVLVHGVLSMMVWAITLTVTIKYILIMLHFHHRGEGGVLALLSFTMGRLKAHPRSAMLATLIGAFAVSLFFGDAVITPAISVLSAVEGLKVVAPAAEDWVVPIALVIIVALFSVQSRGTAAVGKLFGPVMLTWFLTLAILGIASIAQSPEILQALDPRAGVAFAIERPGLLMLVVAAVFLCLTGAEAMYADMGHFGRIPVQLAWLGLVFPCLLLNYFGQGALVLREPGAVVNPFVLLAPPALQLPLVLLATLATIIASQAVITGAFSAAQQASRLNLLPRLVVRHTSETAQGQIYIGFVNWLLLAVVVLLVLGFRSSEALAAAYGIAVSGDLLLTSLLMVLGLSTMSGTRARVMTLVFVMMLAVEAVYFSSNLRKLFEGAWFPLTLALVLFTIMTTWRTGLEMLRARKSPVENEEDMGLNLPLDGAQRVEGAAIFFTATARGFPNAFLHNLKHNKVLHDTTIFLTVDFVESPRVADTERLTITRGTNGIIRVRAEFGFREQADMKLLLQLLERKGINLEMECTSFFISKPTIVSVSRRGVLGWRRSLFGWMLRNSAPVARYFGLPPNRVVELGAQVGI